VTDQEFADSVQALIQARRNGTWIEGLPAVPSSIAEAHAIQDRVAALLGETVGAFKASAQLGSETRRGLIFARMIRPSPARIAAAEVPHLCVESEIAFRFIRDLPAREAPYRRDDVADAVTALPAIEVVSSRFRDIRARMPLEQLADSMVNGALVPGREMRDWSRLDFPSLRVELLVNGESVLERQGGHPTNDPLGVAVTLVNAMREASGVTAGQMVTTGSWTGLRTLKPGDRCTARFEKLGSAEVIFEG
jgi:2-keto-4-pentenoate hydratase